MCRSITFCSLTTPKQAQLRWHEIKGDTNKLKRKSRNILLCMVFVAVFFVIINTFGLLHIPLLFVSIFSLRKVDSKWVYTDVLHPSLMWESNSSKMEISVRLQATIFLSIKLPFAWCFSWADHQLVHFLSKATPRTKQVFYFLLLYKLAIIIQLEIDD